MVHTLLFLLLSVLVPSYAIAQNNISLGSSLTPEGPNKSWLSPSGDFAFGFHPLEANSSFYLLAIWFDQIDEKTVVWYANGNNPVPSGSSLQLTPDGTLSLQNTTGATVWRASITGAAHASMLDNGNFVLSNADGSPRWQSFAEPADTILPSQELASGTILQARLMDTDYSHGRFILNVETGGNLTLYTVAVPSGFKYDAYWSTNTSGKGGKLVFQADGNIIYTLQDGTQQTIMPTDMDSTENFNSFYHRVRLEPDGVLRQYKYPKKAEVSKGEPAAWNLVQAMPNNICDIFHSEFGSGVCGYNSYCRFNASQTECLCAPQYSFFNPERKYKGCKPDFAPQSCDLNEAEVLEQFNMIPMTYIDWPLRAYEQYFPITKSACQNLCLNDCFCAAAVFNENGSCWKKKLPLSNGHEGSGVQRTVFLKLPKEGNSQPQLNIESSNKWKNNRKDWILGGSILLGSSVFVNLLFISSQFLRTNRSTDRKKKIPPQPWNRGMMTRVFTYRELEQATNGFSEEVGRGGSGVVYKGHLQDEVHTCIAVKKIDRIPRETEKEFTTEVATIGHTLHKNLVQLLGFCNEGTERLLVYPFLVNGSLTKFLFGNIRMPWDLRVHVALGVAGGLLYLHEECGKQIIHCDIKPENILIDDNYVAKISDFGLAKLLRAEQTQTSTGIRGTRGYFAPEWFKNVGISTKVDVYSFGIVLLEIICCRRNVELKIANEEQVLLTYWAYDCYRCGRLDLLVEGDEEAILNMKMLERFTTVALWCIQDEPAMRPTMFKVNKMLDGAIEAPQPPLHTPTFISSLL